MTTNPLQEFSQALVALTAAAGTQLTAIRHSEFRYFSGTLWQSDLIVTSEQALPKRDLFEIVLPGGAASSAKLVGRDPATNVALLKLAQPLAAPAARTGDAHPGGLVVAVGADGQGAATVRLGVVNMSGPAWQSQKGGRIDRRIVLDIQLARAEEGGPVFDTEGARLGISAFGPRRQVLVIPSTTVERVVPILLRDGRVARGWLGAALHPVVVPDALQASAGQPSGMMVMSVAEGGPSAKAGVLAGDILVAVAGEPAGKFRKVVSLLGPESVGKELDLRLIRSGGILTLKATISARPQA